MNQPNNLREATIEIPSTIGTPRTTTRVVSAPDADPLTAYDLSLLEEEDRQVRKRDTMRHFIPIWVLIGWFIFVDWFVEHQWTFLRTGLGDGWFHGLVLFAPAMLVSWFVYILMFLDVIRKGSEERIENKIEAMFEGDDEDNKPDVIKDLQSARTKRAGTRRK